MNLKGEILIQKFYREDVGKSAIDAFRSKIIVVKKNATPIVEIENCSFMYTRQNDVYIVGVAKRNVNVTLVFQFIYKLIEVFRAYFNGSFDEESIKEHFALVYELLDETIDHGWPQLTAVNLLTSFIAAGQINGSVREGSGAGLENTITGEITGQVDWRQPGKYKYRKNEVFIDAFEAVNLLLSSKGDILRSDVSGKIVMKTFLTGMPECKFGMNDKLVLDREAKSKVGGVVKKSTGIAIDDVQFHRCVKLGQFDTDRTISFIPPDGEFELMKYRITKSVNLPFFVVPVVTEFGRSRVEYDIKIRGQFSSKLTATKVVVRIPTPPNCAKAQGFEGAYGKVKFLPQEGAIVWKIPKFNGDASYVLKGEVKLIASMKDKPWSRQPITMEFQVPMFSASGLHVRFLKVLEKSDYETIKWVRYMTRAGQYQIRI